MVNLFKSGKKTFVETLFLIAPESEAQKIWSTNRDQLAKDFKSLQEKNIDDEMISWFHCFTVDELYDPAYIAKTRQYLDHDKGRALFVLPEDFAHRLSTMDPSEADTLAEQCLHAEQFVTWKAKELANFLTRLASLAQEAESQKDRVFVLLDASSADKSDLENFKVRHLCLQGDALLAASKVPEALETFLSACAIAEKAELINSIMLEATYSAGNAYWLSGQHDKAIEKFELALRDLDEEDSPGYIHFALGKCHFDSGNQEKAAQEFRKAYMVEGFAEFETEEKYYHFLLSTVSELGKRAKGWNDTLLLIDLHLAREFANNPVAEKVRKMCLEADDTARSKNLPDAISKFWEAFDALPATAESNDGGESSNDDYGEDEDDDDEQDSFARLFIVGAVGNLNFLNKDYTAGADNLRGLGTHPFGLLRFGQCLFELGADEEFAADILAQAYMLAGREIFAEEDPKYIEFLSKFLRPPAGQTEL